MHAAKEITPVVGNDQLSVSQIVQGLPGSKDGKGIGDLVDPDTMDHWIHDYLAACPASGDAVMLGLAFQFGVVVEGRCVSRSRSSRRSRSCVPSGRRRRPGRRGTRWRGRVGRLRPRPRPPRVSAKQVSRR